MVGIFLAVEAVVVLGAVVRAAWLSINHFWRLFTLVLSEIVILRAVFIVPATVLILRVEPAAVVVKVTHWLARHPARASLSNFSILFVFVVLLFSIRFFC